jgi:hypothetical protein
MTNHQEAGFTVTAVDHETSETLSSLLLSTLGPDTEDVVVLTRETFRQIAELAHRTGRCPAFKLLSMKVSDMLAEGL